MKNSITLLLLLCSIVGLVPEANGADYYWVGGSGTWTDLSHWASSSGGAGNAYMTVPTQDDNVVFDNSSFPSGSGETVVLPIGNAYCQNFEWTISGSRNPTYLVFPINSTLNVYGTFSLNSNVEVSYSSTTSAFIKMLGSGLSSVPGVFGGGNQLPNIEFDAVGGEWGITGDLDVEGTLRVTAGTLGSGATGVRRDITVGEFIVDGADASVDLSRMDIIASTKFEVVEAASIVAQNSGRLSSISTPLFMVSDPDDLEYGFLSLTGTDGLLDATGLSLTFLAPVDFSATETNTILGNITYEAPVTLGSPGAIYLFEAGSTQTFATNSDLLADSDCLDYFTIKSTETGSEANFSKPNGDPIEVERFYIQDIHATATQFIAAISFDLGNTDGWDITSPATIDLYWIGGSGNWSDGSNWSTSSGGNAFNCIPNISTNVIFDANSFPGQNETVTVDLPAIYFNNMTWTDPDNDVPTWSIPTGDVLVGGSLTLAPSMLVSLASPTTTEFHFISTAMGNTIDAANGGGIGFDLGNVTFEGTGGWTLNTELKVSGDIVFNNGTFSTGADHNLNATTVSLDGASIDVSFNTSEIFSTTFEVLDYGTFDAGMSNIYTELFDITPSGMSFHEMILLGTEGILRGDDITFFDVKLSSSEKSSVYGDHTYTNELQLDQPGMIVEFEAGSTQTINDLISLGIDCGGQIFLRSTVSGVQANFINPNLTAITVSNLLVRDNAANQLAGALPSFIASSSQDLGNNNDGWSFSSISVGGDVTEFFWIGGTGNWNEGMNWSDVSGGDPINCVPTPNDNVTFDVNSFDGTNDVVTLDGPEQYCLRMLWKGNAMDPESVTGGPIMRLPAGNQLYIYGGMTLASPDFMSLDLLDGDAATFHFNATATNNFIIPGGQSIPNLEFNGPGGGWTISGAISPPDDVETDPALVKTISLLNGSLTIGANIYIEEFLIDGADAALDILTPSLTATDKFDINLIDPLNFNAGTSSITTNILESDIEGVTFNQVILDNLPDDIDASPAVNGNNLIFGTLLLQGASTNFVYGSHQITEALQFHVQGGLAFFYFESGSTQTLGNNAMILRTSETENAPAFVESTVTSSPASFFKASGATCTDYLRITDVNATTNSPGGATFGLIQGTSSVTDATGWTFTDLSCVEFLPVECIDFAAAVKSDNSVELYWITAQEINNSGFEVQRSTDGRRFEAIGWVDGAGTTSEAQKYTFTDLRTEGLTEAYYRIKQIDFDGTAAFACDIQVVNFRQIGAGPMQVFPNPAGEQIQIRWFGKKTGSTLLRLFDQSGRLILNREWNTLEGNNQRELPIAELPRGIYELQLVDTNGQTQGTRLIKQ
ncbi:T9SS type A sorting domain-containing protein [Flavilitoribacter nigricans]|uniref:Secretion system C-terminal sorting domain-containing protein n=1 Tax=Flavilitoribacter nigricans (strain ATCC 23147 / DSM 23189 / NBRC 102662 / NCIMB 1420 / SS-2) TaxID=1122177 RepID=A0A2D0NFR5_FLAN2|nr:T9SS type A sorting domain-containing protein [Flavilitoribacter nigricans]PHN07317.1 hypothetical protein CRP01_06715 [Flavilitoribacter nigricans DSM 23189 = NBRC 102662]